MNPLLGASKMRALVVLRKIRDSLVVSNYGLFPAQAYQKPEILNYLKNKNLKNEESSSMNLTEESGAE